MESRLQDDKVTTIYRTTELPVGYGIETEEHSLICLDPSVGEGKRLLLDKDVTVPQLFALLRQFVPPVCNKIQLIITKLLKKGVKINDVDLLTGFSLLHFAIRSAAIAEKHSLVVVRQLLSQGADPNICSLHDHMNSLHLATYFNLSSVVNLLLSPIDYPHKLFDVNSLCESYDWGSSLHFAVSLLHEPVIQTLLENGASCDVKDNFGRSPIDCLPDESLTNGEQSKVERIQQILRHGNTLKKQKAKCTSKEGKTLHVGSRVVYSPTKKSLKREQSDSGEPDFQGTLRYIGKLHFNNNDNIWVGIELDTETGKNNGTIDSHLYFRCKDNFGIFVKPDQVRKLNVKPPPYKVGERVEVSAQLFGHIRYIGTTHFAKGEWCGIELEDDDGSTTRGRNNGCIGEHRYFTCAPTRGVFVPTSHLQEEQQKTNKKTTGSGAKEHVTSTTLKAVDVKKLNSWNGGASKPSKSKKKIKVGMKVKLNQTNVEACIRFIGETNFSDGIWIGLELQTPDGKNNGTVQGRKYFSCKSNHGLMIRYSHVSIKRNKKNQVYLFKKS